MNDYDEYPPHVPDMQIGERREYCGKVYEAKRSTGSDVFEGCSLQLGTGLMNLLKDKDAFDNWKENNIFSGDDAEEPTEFPCYAIKQVKDWSMQEEYAVYYYKADLKTMLKALQEVSE